MGIKYEQAEDIKERCREVITKLNWFHIDIKDVAFLRSYGSSSRGTVARCHALSRPLQIALKREGFYLIEVISERFDKMPEEDKTKVMIHELMHIPKAFGGGFIHHNVVNDRNVDKIYDKYFSHSDDAKVECITPPMANKEIKEEKSNEEYKKEKPMVRWKWF
jgi:predicted metallopeptidase